jgi:uncharacterized protein VirK/YbjX
MKASWVGGLLGVPCAGQLARPLSWARILSGAIGSYPDWRLRTDWKRLKLAWTLALARPWLARWLAHGSNALLRQQVEQDPVLLGFGVCPYLHAGWSLERRFELLLQHQRIVEQLAPALSMGAEDRRPLLSLAHLSPGLRLELDRSRWFFREGGLVYHLYQHDHRLMSVAFSLAREQGELVAYVGAIQGSHRPEAMEAYRRLTKTLYGLRPRDFVLKTFQLFAGALGVTRIFCVADEYRHQRHPYFGSNIREALHLNYDEVWRENGGRPLFSGFYLLGVSPASRPASEVPVRKRAMYLRRHRLLAELQAALQRELAPGSR